MPQHADNPDIQRALDWFLSFLDPDEWIARKDAIENHLEQTFTIHKSREEAGTPKPVSINTDTMGWYLYLAETALMDITRYEPIQGARVLPIFERLGTDLAELTQIEGIERKVQNLLGKDRGTPDSGLFEIVVALLWKRNGWEHVELIPEAPPEKRPDICARSGDTEWFIECKRMAKTSGYSQREREKWLRMWRQIADFMTDRRMPFVLDIVFHVELETLPDEFVRDELAGKLPLLVSFPCNIISNDIWDVRVWTVDFDAANRHLHKNYVKYPSDQLTELIAGKGHRDPNKGFTCVVGGNKVRIGGGRGNNRYMDTMDFAAGAFWDCDADRAIERKARDIRARLSEAVEQLPDDKPCVVHVGLETLDGVSVEAERYQRIFNTVRKFDARGKDLQWVFCHLYQSYAPPEKAWVMDETAYYFSHSDYADDKPLSNIATLAPSECFNEDGVHWLKDAP